MLDLKQQQLLNEIRDIRRRVLRLETQESGGNVSTVTTTNGTQTTLHTFTVPTSTTYAVEVHVVARRTGGTSGTAEDGAYYILRAVYKNAGGTATIIGSVNQTLIGESQAGWNATLDTTGSTVRVRVTGAANNNIAWLMVANVYSVST